MIDPEKIGDIDDTMDNREIAKRMSSDAVSRGDAIAGGLADLENAASPFFLGVDEDEDSSDMDVYP